MAPKITVFTPTYNRGYIIKRLYDSLRAQSYTGFEWIVIDDGSTDETASLLAEWAAETREFPLTYRRVENGGKHRAINLGVEMAGGDLFFIVDSDDYLAENALERLVYWEGTIAGMTGFAGVGGLRGFSEDEVNGKAFTGEYRDATSLERGNVFGDKAEAFYTEVLRKYRFPEYEGENFLVEGIVWGAIADDGLKIRWFNEIIYIGDYLEDGLSKSGAAKLLANPKGYLHYVRQMLTYKMSRQDKLVIIAVYTKISKQMGLGWRQASREIGVSPLVFLAVKAAYVFYKGIRRGH
ncbi:MAG: glycosyltransferase family 2 protein [Lachnospiraceae bacterium]|jgi:glycosyltransferase involved in cell wall biosynthesis|nr:glycosyltransferase family 2 protein [Lachnospiraceae bacterium]